MCKCAYGLGALPIGDWRFAWMHLAKLQSMKLYMSEYVALLEATMHDDDKGIAGMQQNWRLSTRTRRQTMQEELRTEVWMHQ